MRPVRGASNTRTAVVEAGPDHPRPLTGATTPIPVVPAQRRPPTARRARTRLADRPVPVRDERYAQLSVEELRERRTTVTTDEGKVSYWRRLVSTRLDVVRAGHALPLAEVELLQPILAGVRHRAARSAAAEAAAGTGGPGQPDLDGLWSRLTAGDPEGLAALERELAAAQHQLSEHRTALHQELAAVTAELIARYRDEPALCLSALPLPRSGSGSQPGSRPA